MRALAATLTPLLLLGSLRAQEAGPAEMVARIFEETRPLAEALWRDYQAANEDESFSGQMSDLAGWPQYVERVDGAAAIRFAADLAPDADSSRYGYGLLAINVAMGWLHCEYLPKQQLVRLGSTQDPPDAEWDPYVRVVQLDSEVWRIASWPPVRLEDLFSQREKYPDRLSLTILLEPDGFRLEHRGTTLAASTDPAPVRWERFDRFLQDVVWPSRRIGERGESLDGVLIRVPAEAPVTALLEVLARLGQPGRRVPDVQLWVTGGDFPTYFELDQRGAWGEDLEVLPLRMPPEFRVADALAAARSAGAIELQSVAFVLPWQDREPDPALWITELDRLASPICSQFWMYWYAEQGTEFVSGSTPEQDDPAFLRMVESLTTLLEPHRAADLPRLTPEQSSRIIEWHTMRRAFPRNPLIPGEAWMVASRSQNQGLLVVRLVHRTTLSPTLGGEDCWLRLEDGAWKFCSWPRYGRERPMPRLASAPGYQPLAQTLHASLRWEVGGPELTVGFSEPISGTPDLDFVDAFDAWLEKDSARDLGPIRQLAERGDRADSITLWADPAADQYFLIPLLKLLGREYHDPCSQLRLQVDLDETGRPGEVIFDQSVLLPGATVGDSVAIWLRPGGSVQDLCDQVDRLHFGGARRFHLLPPE